MTNQEAFETMVRHLRKQGKRSTSARGIACRYRGTKGMACAVGVLIPDKEYSPTFEGHGAEFVAKKVPTLQSVSLDILLEMQMIHDNDAVKSWEDSFDSAAKRFSLTLPPLEEASHA